MNVISRYVVSNYGKRDCLQIAEAGNEMPASVITYTSDDYKPRAFVNSLAALLAASLTASFTAFLALL